MILQKDSFIYRFRLLYYYIRRSPFQKPLYYLYDWYTQIVYMLMKKTKITPEDKHNVEKQITFIYKSFCRQKQARRLYKSIKAYYPHVRVIIADDSKEPLEILNIQQGDVILHLPFNSGLSKGLIAMLDQVETPFVMRMDDDELLIRRSLIHQQLAFLQKHPEVDLVGIQANWCKPEKAAQRMKQIRMSKELLIPAGTVIDKREVVYKPPNVFLVLTDSIKKIGYDPNIRMIDHHEFFYRAAGQIVCVQDPHSTVMHCHNRFENAEYNQYRGDIMGDSIYIREKIGQDVINKCL